MMKRLFTFLILSFISIGLFAQLPIAVDDRLDYRLGETITFNPLKNDHLNSALELVIDTVLNPKSCTILSYTDSTVTFKMDDYIVFMSNDECPKLEYRLEADHPSPIGATIKLNPIFESIDTLDVNQIKTPIFPLNIQFENTISGEYSGYFYPSDSHSTTIYNSSIWIGGKDANNELHLAAERYRQNGEDFWPGPLSVDGNTTTDSLNAANWLRTWKVSREEINQHITSYNNPDYEMPEAILNWPAHGNRELNQDDFIAPFVDVDQDLKYKPEQGDYPFIKGDISVFFIYNDQLEHTESQGQSLGVEILCMAWAFENQREETPYNSTIFYSYKFINRSTEDYFDTYIGVFSDLDLGYAWDDYIGCHVENGNFYAFNGDEIDGDGEPESFGEFSPSQSVCILGGPFMDPDQLDNPLGQCDESINGAGFGDGELDNERYGMNRFVAFSNVGPGPVTDPEIAPEYYNLLKGIWKDNSSMCMGGSGHQDYGGNANLPTRFMFQEDSDACNWGTGGIDPGFSWSEENANNQPGDRRGLASMGPFTFEAGSVEYIDIAYVTAPYSPDKASKELVQDFIAEIKQDYLVNPMDFGFQYTNIEEVKKESQLLEIYPNPINGDQIWFDLDVQDYAVYVIYNTAGQEVERGSLQSDKQHQLNVASLKSGWYLLEIKSSNKIYRSKMIK